MNIGIVLVVVIIVGWVLYNLRDNMPPIKEAIEKWLEGPDIGDLEEYSKYDVRLEYSAISVTIALPADVVIGSEIRVETDTPALFISDSLGNTYVRNPQNRKKWTAINISAGALDITTTWSASGIHEVKVAEWR